MIDALSNMFGVIGANFSSPTTVAEFFTYFFNCLISFCCVAGFFQFLRFAVACVTKGGRNL